MLYKNLLTRITLKLKHNKKQNTGVLFSCFSSLYSDYVIHNNVNGVNKLNEIFHKYFIKSPLLKEYKLYFKISSLKENAVSDIEPILDLAIKEYKQLDPNKLKALRQGFLTEIFKLTTPQKFFDYTVPKYKVYASINQVLFEGVKGVTIDNYLQLKSLKNVLVENCKANSASLLTENAEPEVLKLDIIDIATVLKHYRNKYSIYLNESQQEILNKYLTTFDDKQLGVYLDNERLKLIEIVDNSNIKDNVLHNSLKTALKELSTKFKTLDAETKAKKILEAYNILQQVKD